MKLDKLLLLLSFLNDEPVIDNSRRVFQKPIKVNSFSMFAHIANSILFTIQSKKQLSINTSHFSSIAFNQESDNTMSSISRGVSQSSAETVVSISLDSEKRNAI